MATVIPFNKPDDEETLTGPAICTNCKHRWTAVTPAGQVDCLECEACHTFMGVIAAPVVPDEFWQCNCGGELFFLTRAGAQCRTCGLISNDWAE